MRLSYSAPVPLQAGCSASYWFPTEYYDAAEITSIRISGFLHIRGKIYRPAGSPLTSDEGEFVVAEVPSSETGGVAYKSVTFTACEIF